MLRTMFSQSMILTSQRDVSFMMTRRVATKTPAADIMPIRIPSQRDVSFQPPSQRDVSFQPTVQPWDPHRVSHPRVPTGRLIRETTPKIHRS